MDGTWVKNYREIKEWKYYKVDGYAHLWQHLIREAHHSNDLTFDGYGNEIGKGKFSTGRNRLAEETGLSASKVERILKKLEIEQQIEQVKFNKCRVISITNWSKWQSSEQVVEQQVNNKRTTGEQQVNNKRTQNKNVKNVKNVKNDKNITTTKKDESFLAEIVSLWNDSKIRVLPCIREITDKRKKSLRQCIKELYTMKTIEGWKELFETANTTPFLTGDNDRNWKASFDWLINKNNAVKVLEGNYKTLTSGRPRLENPYE